MKEQSSNPCEKVSFILTYDQFEAAYNIYREQFISCDFIRRTLERLEEGIGLCNLPYETLHDNPNLLHEAYLQFLRLEDCNVAYNDTLEQVIDVMKEAESKGQTVARLHTGDPCLYGAIREQIDALDALGIAHDDCPGVSSFCGAAAALEMEYTLPDISQSVVITRMVGRTPVPERESIASFAAHQATMVVFLSTGLLEELSRELIAGGYTADTPAAIVYKATWPEEKTFVCTVGTLAETAKKNQITKTALMIIGNAVSQGNYRRSDLYNPAFTTEFREAEK